MQLGLFLKLFSSNQDPDVGIFKTSDYALNRDERQAKYKGYEYIVCGKCGEELNNNYYCTYCYNKETDTCKRNRMKYGSKVRIFKTLDYTLDRYERIAKNIRVTIMSCAKNVIKKLTSEIIIVQLVTVRLARLKF